MVLLNNDLIDDLKCCGNCKHRIDVDIHFNVVEECLLDDVLNKKISNRLCKYWKYDNLKKADRLG